MNFSRTQIDAIVFFLNSVETVYSAGKEKLTLEVIFKNSHHQPLFEAGMTIQDIDTFCQKMQNRGYRWLTYGYDLSTMKSAIITFVNNRDAIQKKFDDYSIDMETLRMTYQVNFDKYQAYFISQSGVEQWVTAENGDDLVEAMKTYQVNCSYDRFTRTFSF